MKGFGDTRSAEMVVMVVWAVIGVMFVCGLTVDVPGRHRKRIPGTKG